MLSALRLRKLKLSFQRRLYGDKVTEFHIVGNGCLDDSVNENEIPLAIIENGVYKSNSKNAPRRLADNPCSVLSDCVGRFFWSRLVCLTEEDLLDTNH